MISTNVKPRRICFVFNRVAVVIVLRRLSVALQGFDEVRILNHPARPSSAAKLKSPNARSVHTLQTHLRTVRGARRVLTGIPLTAVQATRELAKRAGLPRRFTTPATSPVLNLGGATFGSLS